MCILLLLREAWGWGHLRAPAVQQRWAWGCHLLSVAGIFPNFTGEENRP